MFYDVNLNENNIGFNHLLFFDYIFSIPSSTTFQRLVTKSDNLNESKLSERIEDLTGYNDLLNLTFRSRLDWYSKAPKKTVNELAEMYHDFFGNSKDRLSYNDSFLEFRVFALILSENYDVNICEENIINLDNPKTKKTETIKLLLKKLPFLNSDIDLDHFKEFKRDPDSKLKLAALRNWMTDITYTQYTQNEIEDKMEFLLMQYQDHMHRAKLKYTLGSAEFWITAVPEIINDLAHFKLGSAAKALFGFAKKELMLLEEERKAPGKELAFVYKAQQEFGK